MCIRDRENTYMINIKENASDVKKAIKKYGAVGIMYSHNDTGYPVSYTHLDVYKRQGKAFVTCSVNDYCNKVLNSKNSSNKSVSYTHLCGKMNRY